MSLSSSSKSISVECHYLHVLLYKKPLFVHLLQNSQKMLVLILDYHFAIILP